MIMDPLAEFARNFPLLPTTDDKKALQVLLKQRLSAFAHEAVEPRQKALKSPEELHYYIGRLDMKGTPAAYVIEAGNARTGFYKEPDGPYEIYENGKSTGEPKQIFNMLDYYSYCSDFLKSLSDDITVTEFVESKGKEEEGAEEEEEAPKATKRKKTEEKEVVEVPAKPSKRKRSATKKEEKAPEEQEEEEADKMEIDAKEEAQKGEEEEEPPKKKTRKKRSTTSKKKKSGK